MDENDENKVTQALPALEKEERVLRVVKLKEGVTKPPKLYTVGQLNSANEDLWEICRRSRRYRNIEGN